MREGITMKKPSLRWKTLVPLALAAAGLSVASNRAGVVRVAIMTDCKGAFGFGYEPDIGGAEAAFATYAGGKAVNPKKPSAGMNGITAGGKQIKIVGYGCGNDTV